METIRFEDVSFTYPLGQFPALRDVSLTIHPGEFVVICGKSGYGKSTFLRQIKKELTPYGRTEGRVLYGDLPIAQLPPRKSAAAFGFVMQNPDSQLVTDKVWHELAFGLENLGLPCSTIKRRVAEMASYFGILDIRREVCELSGGQKQLLNLASVMAMQPEVLLLDEPTSQLDPIAASDFLQTIYRINRELGTTVILSEHRLEEAFPLADRVLVLDGGRLTAWGTPREVACILQSWPGGPHPMYKGMPAVMRIFENAPPPPLTLREGRLRLEKMLTDRELPPAPALSDSSSSSQTETAVELRDVWFRYQRGGEPVLRGLSMQVQRGEWLALLGGNGVGKSTALKAVCGEIKPQRGKVLVDGMDAGHAIDRQLFSGRLALVPQDPLALFTEITVEEELFEGICHLPLSDEEKLRRVSEMLETMEITHLRSQNPYDLSGGEQQRLAIGKVLLTGPSILLLDEPTKGLDPFFKRTLGLILKRLQRDGLTICMVSHDIDFCAEHADRCALFFDGEVVSEGSPHTFFAGNRFYTTTANQLTRLWRQDIITVEEAKQWLQDLV